MLKITALLLAILLAGACDAQVLKSAAETPLTTPIGPVPGMEAKPKPETSNVPKDKAAVSEGRKYFIKYNCYGCHGGHAGGGMGPSLRGEMHHPDAHYFQTIALGREIGMPAWGTKLTEAEIWKLVAYLKTPGTSKEPDAPK